jgi:protein O-GlcNAc transferase
MFRKVLKLFGGANPAGPEAPAMAEDSVAAAADLLIAQGNRAEEKADFASAVERYREAVALAPAYARVHVNLGIALEGIGQIDQACRAFATALTCDPNEVTANYNLGRILFSRNAHEEAETLLRRAVDHDPAFADARIVLSRLLENRGDLTGAASELEQALQSRPDYAGALRNYADVLAKLQRLDDAVDALRRAAELEPDNYDSNYRLGCALIQLDRPAEAESPLNAALLKKPDSVEAMASLTYLYMARGSYQAAAAHAEAALKLRPDWVDLLFDYGAILQRLSRPSEAEAAFRRVLELAPTYVRAYKMLGAVLLARGRVQDALEIFSQGRARCAEPFDLESPELFALNCLSDISAEELFARHATFGRRLEQLEPVRFERYDNTADRDRRLRVGFVSPDLQMHVVSSFLLPLLEHRDRTQTEIYCYSSGETSDHVTRLLRAQADGWRNINKMPARQAADLIHGDSIDILIDLAGHSGEPVLRIFAQRPAPVQATWLGYLNTTGLTRIDYRISDHVCDPPGLTDRFHTEKLIRLPHAQWCYRPFAQVEPQPESPVRSNGYITFGSFNQTAKINRNVRKTWAAILNAVPDSRLRIVGVADELAREDLYGDFTAAGVERARISMVPYVAPDQYFAQYGQVDIALDTTPFSGGTTTCDAVLMGVPVITVPGVRSWSRSAASVLTLVGLKDWIATSEDDYVRRAATFAAEIATLVELRKSLRARVMASPLMDERQFAVDMQDVWRKMWHSWCAQ